MNTLQIEAAVKVEYKLTADDYAALFRFHARHAPQGQPRYVGWLVLILLGLVAFTAIAWILREPNPLALPLQAWALPLLFLVYAFFYLFGRTLSERFNLTRMRKNPQFFRRVTLAISEEALTSSDESSAVTYLWHAVVRIVENVDYAFFYVSEGTACILPRRAFADEREFETFVDTARHYRREARRFVRPEGQA